MRRQTPPMEQHPTWATITKQDRGDGITTKLARIKGMHDGGYIGLDPAMDSTWRMRGWMLLKASSATKHTIQSPVDHH